jgi:methanogenic corrinoid protein MtbC1
VPAEDFVEKALAVDACIIGVSAMTLTTALNIRKLRDLIDARDLRNRIKLVVGGAVFTWRPELVGEVGGDGTAANAASVDAVVSKLQAEVLEGATQ